MYVAMDAVAAPAGLRGSIKLEAYHQSRQPHSFSLSPLMFRDFGSLCQGVAASLWPAVAAAAVCGCEDVAASLCKCDVAASECVCSCGAADEVEATAVLLSRHLYLPTSMLLPRKKRRTQEFRSSQCF